MNNKHVPLSKTEYLKSNKWKQYLESEEHKLYLKDRREWYPKSEKFRLYQKDYYKSKREKESQKRYQQSDKYKQYLKKYYKSNKFKDTRKAYEDSGRGLVCRKKYQKSSKGKISKRRAKAKRERNMNWILLFENPFNGRKVEYHHISDAFVVAIPEELHKKYGGYNKEAHRHLLKPVVEELYNFSYTIEERYNRACIDEWL